MMSSSSRPSFLRRLHRARTPTILQMEAVECGAAALGMVLGYYGRFVSLEELRAACGVSRDGSKASNLIEAARKYGLEARGLRLEPHALEDLPRPFIVFWNFNHFLVVESFGRQRVFLNDPANGPRSVSQQEFDRAFTGVVLSFEPGPDFHKGGQRPSIFSGLRTRLQGYETALAFFILSGLALLAPGLVIPTFSRIFVDQYLVQGLDRWVMPLLIGMALTAVLRATLTWLQRAYLARMEAKLALTTSSQFFWHVLRLPVDFYNQRYGGEIGARLALNDRLATLLSGELVATALNLVLVFFYAALMAQYDLLLTSLGVVIALVNLVALSAVARTRSDANQRLLQEKGKLMATTLSGLQNIETIKATGGEADFFSRWAGYLAKVVNAEQQMGSASQILAVLPTFLNALTTLAVLTLGGLRVMEGQLSMGELVAFQSLMASFLAPMAALVSMGSSLQEIQGAVRRLDDVLRHPIDPEVARLDAPSAPPLAAKLAGNVELKNITFGYSRLAPPLIENFNMVLKPGGRVALVGGTGSGKSTVIKLIAGLYEPWSGEILFDGRARNSLPRSAITNSLAFVDQDIFLFEDSIQHNLTLWDPTVPEANILEAAKDACIHEDILLKPGGYEYRILEDGRNFSGGQRQRLEIARALVGNPSILILDEATSALDTYTEKRIDDHLRRRGCTCLIVAHRLSTIRDCDEIIVLERGKILQRGTHEELLSDREGLYARLIQSGGNANLLQSPESPLYAA